MTSIHARAEQLVRKWQRDDPKGCMPSQLIAAIEAALREQAEAKLARLEEAVRWLKDGKRFIEQEINDCGVCSPRMKRWKEWLDAEPKQALAGEEPR